jgi:hypothetical protein
VGGLDEILLALEMEGLEEVLLALSALESSTNQNLQHTVQWRYKIDGDFYELKESEGLELRAHAVWH